MKSGEISGIRNNLECNVSDSENPTNTSWQMSIQPNFCKIKERKGTLNIGFIRNRMQRKFLAAFNWMQKKYFSTKTWWRKRDLCIFSRRFWVVFSSLCGTCKHLSFSQSILKSFQLFHVDEKHYVVALSAPGLGLILSMRLDRWKDIQSGNYACSILHSQLKARVIPRRFHTHFNTFTENFRSLGKF